MKKPRNPKYVRKPVSLLRGYVAAGVVAWRELTGMRQSDLARFCKVSEMEMHHIETARGELRTDTLEKLCRAFAGWMARRLMELDRRLT